MDISGSNKEMNNSSLPLWKRWLYWWSPDYRPIPTRLTQEQAIDLARAAAAQLGVYDFSSISAEPIRKSQRIIWDVWINLEIRDGSTHIIIDDATGEVLECRIVGLGNPPRLVTNNHKK